MPGIVLSSGDAAEDDREMVRVLRVLVTQTRPSRSELGLHLGADGRWGQQAMVCSASQIPFSSKESPRCEAWEEWGPDTALSSHSAEATEAQILLPTSGMARGQACDKAQSSHCPRPEL